MPRHLRGERKFSILNWAMHLTPARGTERGCGRRPSRSAWQMRKTSEPLHALRLVLRTQPRSDRPTCVKCIALILNDQFSLSWLGFPQIVRLLSRGLERQFHLASAPRRRVSGKHDFQHRPSVLPGDQRWFVMLHAVDKMGHLLRETII